ncbi:TetR/AcrR family transcriptional regulator [Bosea caraganae]|uniref:TetR/AcrR family transcriptional regulator n=1 Tax=Bosea caraganae TaxID=2763117 RepID=UPI0015F0E9D8|nr:TetR/AcrR family transcriptional regulator [Bosea caraganae]
MSATDAAPPSAPPARSPRGAQRGEAILDAARALFLEKGFAATSIDDIVARAGGSKATIYNLFGDKAGLFRALISRFTEDFLETVVFADLPETLPPREALRMVGRAAASSILSQPQTEILRLAAAEGIRFPELGRGFWAAGPVTAGAVVARYLARQHALGTLNVPDPELASDVFYSITIDRRAIRLLLAACEPPTPEEIDRFVAESTEIFLRAFAPA